MPRRQPVPPLRRHAPSGQGRVRLSGQDHYLGRWPEGLKNPPAAVLDAYNRLLAEWLANGRRPLKAAEEPIVAELVAAFLTHAERHYRHPDGSPTKEADNFRHALRPLLDLYAELPIAEFSPAKLKAVRQKMIDAGWARTTVNAATARVVRVFKWGVAEELVPAEVWRALTCVRGLARGRTAAPEPEPVAPVPDEVLRATEPHLFAPVRAMVRLQRLTGMRPGEVVALRPCDVDTSGEVWVYSPPRHKTAWRGRPRRVFLGPKAQAVLAPFLDRDPSAYCFSPAEAAAERKAMLRRARKSKVQPSQVSRAKEGPKLRSPRDRYTVGSYRRSVGYACARAGVDPWSPGQIRHTFATEARKAFGLAAVAAALGHAESRVTEIYAAADDAAAARVAKEAG